MRLQAVSRLELEVDATDVVAQATCVPDHGGFVVLPLLQSVSFPCLYVGVLYSEPPGGLLIFGIGLETGTAACTAAVLLCVIFYGSSKVLIYCFLVEKVHLVWSPTTGIGGRLKSRVWLACMSLNVGYLVVVFLMCLGLIHYHRDDGLCIIGIKPFSSITLLVFDLFITIVLNVLFLFPLIRSKIANPRLRAVAIRTAFASIVALVTSTVNIAVVTAMKGHELGWVCLGSCAADVILNALTIFYITSSSDVSGHLTDAQRA
ncbi:hypothetical protein AAF712_009755 [Marasmius tenuissimus]|uniref:Transmembrane protein n=1 Tax=Marasmius tenuissimus TaxID=585030 RepID=A0ABR2ZNY9_9AGAR